MDFCGDTLRLMISISINLKEDPNHMMIQITELCQRKTIKMPVILEIHCLLLPCVFENFQLKP